MRTARHAIPLVPLVLAPLCLSVIVEAKDPDLVQVVNDTVFEPYLQTDGTLIVQNGVVTFLSFDVPNGKRLIIETVSVIMQAYAGGYGQAYLIAPSSTRTGPTRVLLTMQPQGRSSDDDLFIHGGTQPIHVRVDTAGTNDEVQILFVTKDVLTVNATVSGYLVNAPFQRLD